MAKLKKIELKSRFKVKIKEPNNDPKIAPIRLIPCIQETPEPLQFAG